MRGAGADGFVVPSKPGNAGGGEGTRHSGRGGRPASDGRSRCLRQGLLRFQSPVGAGRAAGGWSVGAG